MAVAVVAVVVVVFAFAMRVVVMVMVGMLMRVLCMLARGAGSGVGCLHAMIGNLKVTLRSSPMSQLPQPPLTPLWRIGEAARHTGVSSANIRFYEKQGLLPAPARQENAYRSYSDADLHRLRFIRMCRAMDMSLAEVRTLLDLHWDSPEDCRAATQTVADHLGHVRQRLAELQALEQALQALHQRCSGAGDARCALLAALHDQAEAGPWNVVDKEGSGKRHV